MTEHTGQCMCGSTTFIASGNPSAAHACHCEDCQRFSGSAFIGVDFDKIDVAGTVNWFHSSEWGERGSCKTCGSAMFWRMRDGSGKPVVGIGTLNARDKIEPIDRHYFADNIPSAFDFTGTAKRLSREETFAFFTGAKDE